ncbi:hypothetical protein D9M68_888770 [compost metagenome]
MPLEGAAKALVARAADAINIATLFSLFMVFPLGIAPDGLLLTMTLEVTTTQNAEFIVPQATIAFCALPYRVVTTFC